MINPYLLMRTYGDDHGVGQADVALVCPSLSLASKLTRLAMLATRSQAQLGEDRLYSLSLFDYTPIWTHESALEAAGIEVPDPLDDYAFVSCPNHLHLPNGDEIQQERVEACTIEICPPRSSGASFRKAEFKWSCNLKYCDVRMETPFIMLDHFLHIADECLFDRDEEKASC